jgi:hypothetical protein
MGEKRQVDWSRFIKFICIGACIIIGDLIWLAILEFDSDIWGYAILICLVGIKFIDGAFSIIGQYIAEEKKYGDMHVFALCLWTGIIGWLVVIASPDRGTQIVEEKARPSSTNHRDSSRASSARQLDDAFPRL